MGKTLGAILTIGAAIAINVIPGIGQAISGAIVGLGGGTFGALGVAQAVVGALTLGVTAAGIQSLGGLLGLGPSAGKPDTTATAIKTPRPPRVSAYGASRLYPAYILFETAADGTAVDVGAVHDGQLTQVLQYYLADDKVTLSGNTVNAGPDGRYGGGNLHLYSTTGANPGAAISAVTAKIPAWTSAHRGDGVVQLALLAAPVKSKHFLDIYPNGVPQASMAAKWQKCPDPHAADPSNPAGWTWTENPIRQLMHYKLVREGVDYATKIAPSLAYWQAASDVCDAAIALKAGGTEARYRSCVAHKHTDSHGTVTAALLETCDGWIAPRSDGALIVYAGQYYEPTVSIGPDQIVAFEWSGVGVDDDEAVNEFICSYVSAAHDYNTVETDACRDEDDIEERGQVLSDDFSPQVPSWGQVRRLAKRKMARTNAPYRGTVTTNVSGRIVRGERYINLTLTDAGTTFFDGVAEIVAVTRNIATGGVTFSWVAADPNVDAWNPATEEGSAAAQGDRVASAPLDAPTVDSAVAIFAETTDQGTGVRVQIDAEGPARSDLTWFARWQIDGAAVWNEQQYPDTDPGSAVTLLTGFVPIAPVINVEVAYQTGDGRVSPWSETSVVDTRTDVTAPDAAAAITLVNWSDELVLATDRIARASSYRWRFYQDDGTTLVRTIVTTAPQVAYTAGQAATDGARRAYVVKVAGVNGAGAGTEAATSTLTLDAPDAVTGLVANDGATESEIDFDIPAGTIAGFLIAVSNTSGFDPMTQGTLFHANGSPYFAQNLAAGTFYAKVAAYDAWTDRPDLLNFSTEDSFTISTGGGGIGGGGGGGGGGWCPEITLPIQMANAAHDGPGEKKRAGDIVGGDWVWTRPELADGTLGEWGAYRVSAVEIVTAPVFRLEVGIEPWRATARHRIWLSGWAFTDALGVPDGSAEVARITVEDAHTYYGNGLLHHNIKPVEPP